MEMEVIKCLSILVLGTYLGVLGYRQRLKTLDKTPNMDLYLNDFRILDLYETINDALRTNQGRLTFVVTEMNTNTFAEVYHSLRNNQFKFELRCSKSPRGEDVEYLDFDFSSYHGPRNKTITPIWSRVEAAKSLKDHQEYFKQDLPPSVPTRRPVMSQGNIIPLFFRQSEKKTYTDNVIKVDFKNKKVVSG